MSNITGSVEVTAEGWLHIRLDALLPNCRYGTAAYISDAILELLDGMPESPPYYDKAFLFIDEHGGLESRRVYDQDNKAWKAIPNALKGRVFEDDDQFTLSICLMAKEDKEVACHIYVTPPEDAFLFLYKRYGDA